MNNYKVSYTINGMGRAKNFRAESEGEAVEMFEEWAERFDGEAEFLSIKEAP